MAWADRGGLGACGRRVHVSSACRLLQQMRDARKWPQAFELYTLEYIVGRVHVEVPSISEELCGSPLL